MLLERLDLLERGHVRLVVVLREHARDLIRALGRDEQDRALERRDAREDQVQEDERGCANRGRRLETQRAEPRRRPIAAASLAIYGRRREEVCSMSHWQAGR